MAGNLYGILEIVYAECERLRAENAKLKAQLVEALKGLPKPATAAERMRKMRAAKAQREGQDG